jgi:von Willebrand factor type A domain
MNDPTRSYQINDWIHLVRQPVGSKATATPPAPPPTDHILVVDCSGSMSYDLPKIREQLKRRLPKTLAEADTVSIVWFSSRGQFGTLLEGEPVATLADLKSVENAIDRWLRPVGMTGFKEPIEEAAKLAERLKKKRPNAATSLFFLSDGGDNQWSRADVIKAVEKAAGGFAAATVVEYGYYADRPMLASMAAAFGGSHIFADTFEKYEPSFEQAMGKKPQGAKRIEVTLAGAAIGELAFALVGGDIVTFATAQEDDGPVTVSVPEGLTELWYLGQKSTGKGFGELTKIANESSWSGGTSLNYALDAAYAAVSLFATRMRSDIVKPLLKALGDVSFIKDYAGCFGKQRYSAFQEKAKEAAFKPACRFLDGYDPSLVPPEDAFTVLELLEALQADDGNRLLLSHPAFRYSKIGRGRVDANTRLTTEESEELGRLTSELAGQKDLAKIKEIQARISELTNKPEPLVFAEDEAGKAEGYPVSGLVYNEDRPNVSVRIRREGTVDLSARLPEAFKGAELGKIPARFPTFTFRNYAVISNGLVNVAALPVRLTPATWAELYTAVATGRAPANFIGEREPDGTTVLNVAALPILNEQMVGSASAKALFEESFRLLKAQASQKVFNAYLKDHFPGKKSESFKALYGDEAAAWLAVEGITDYSGFGPKVLQAEATDVYMAKELLVKLKGYSTLPSLNDFKKQASKGKFNGPGELMRWAVSEVETFMASKPTDEAFEAWLIQKAKETTAECRKHLLAIAKQKFTILVGQIWFTEFSSLDEKTLDLSVDGTAINATAELREFEEKI